MRGSRASNSPIAALARWARAYAAACDGSASRHCSKASRSAAEQSDARSRANQLAASFRVRLSKLGSIAHTTATLPLPLPVTKKSFSAEPFSAVRHLLHTDRE